MDPRIGIITYGDDPHGHLIKKKIEEQHGVWCCLIPSDELVLRGGLTWSSQREAPALLPTIDGQTVDVRTLNAQWYRRTALKQTLPEGADADYELHIIRSTERVLEGILLNACQGRWVSHPIATRLAENKLVQLRAAQHAGLRIPATLVSQDPAHIRRFCAAHPGAIIKPVATPRGIELASTAVVSQELLDNEEVLALDTVDLPGMHPGHAPPAHLRRWRALRWRAHRGRGTRLADGSRTCPSVRTRSTAPSNNGCAPPSTSLAWSWGSSM